MMRYCFCAESLLVKGLIITNAGPVRRLQLGKEHLGHQTKAPARPIVKLQAIAGSVS
jgi:hypothetical protein